VIRVIVAGLDCLLAMIPSSNVEPITIFFYLVAVYAACSFVLIISSSESSASSNGPADGHGGERVYLSKILKRGRDETKVGFPRLFGYYFDDEEKIVGARRLPAESTFYYPSKREVRWTESDEKGRKLLLNSVPFTNEDHRALKPYQDAPECVPMHEWQISSFPACNDIHQVDLSDLSHRRNKLHRQVRIIANGASPGVQ